MDSSQPADLSPARVAREFRRLIDSGATVSAAGEAKDDPSDLLYGGYLPKYKIELFDTKFYLTNVLQNPAIRFFVAYVVQDDHRGRSVIYPRIFYKDLSLIWRCASHMISTDNDFWIGKGDVVTLIEGDREITDSLESTTDLPLEIQSALELLNRKVKKVRFNEEALYLVLRNGPDGRIAPYSDFSGPRARAAKNPRNLINRGRSIAHFAKKCVPSSLKVVAGFEPDFSRGILEVGYSRSAMYGGDLHRYRILSKNRKIQYLFIAGPSHVWIIPPQATTTELSSFGVRTIDVVADEDLFVPGFEYHTFDEMHASEFDSQIPEGFAGEPSPYDPARADASKWLDQIPMIVEFRRKVLRK